MGLGYIGSGLGLVGFGDEDDEEIWVWGMKKYEL